MFASLLAEAGAMPSPDLSWVLKWLDVFLRTFQVRLEAGRARDTAHLMRGVPQDATGVSMRRNRTANLLEQFISRACLWGAVDAYNMGLL